VRTRTRRDVLRCCAGDGAATRKRVVVVGGTGRVGSATAAALVRLARRRQQVRKEKKSQNGDGYDGNGDGDAMETSSYRWTHVEVVLAGRDAGKAEIARKAWPEELADATFQYCDTNKQDTIDACLSDAQGVDLVIHAAGPFQQSEDCAVLQAALRNKVPYIDVCDDAEHTKRAREQLGDRAKQLGVPCCVSCGIYPGLSNVMASYMCKRGSPKQIRYAYFTAGSGGVGPTILATSVLLLGETVEYFVDGKKQVEAPYARRQVLDFGQKVGEREVFLLSLPEIMTSHQVFAAPSVSAYFGTSPGVWNTMMQLMAKYLPKPLLQSRDFANGLAGLIMPLVRAVDKLVGETTAMRVDVKYENGKTSSSLFVHPKTPHSAGAATCAFADAVLNGQVPPGVHFPEEDCVLGGEEDKYKQFFEVASEGAQTFALAQAPWRIGTTPKQMGMGIYL